MYKGQNVFIKVGDERLKDEASVLGKVKYKNIPQLIELTNLLDGRFQLIMELFPGQPLDEYIELDSSWNSRKLPIKEAQAIITGLVNCLIVLRNKGYLYRDLNFNHVLIDGARVSLVDMEAAVKFESQAIWRTNSRTGTWEVMPHEEFRVGNRLLENAITYSLGVTTLQLATGSNPFFVSIKQIPNHEVRRVFVRELHKEIPLIHTSNNSLDAFLAKALQPVPSKRFEKIEDFQSALNNISFGTGVK